MIPSLVLTLTFKFIIEVLNYSKVEAGCNIPLVIGHGPQGKIEKRSYKKKKIGEQTVGD